MTVNEKIKTLDNKIDQNKAQYNINLQTAKMFALPSGDVDKYEFLTGEDILPEERLLEKATTIKKTWIFAIR